MEINGLGVLLQGASGIGKSEIALSLICRGHSLVSDDVTNFRVNSIDGKLIGSASDVTRDYLAIRGLGIVYVPKLYGAAATRGEKSLDLIVELKAQKIGQDCELVRASYRKIEIMGVELPAVTIPVTAGKNVASVVEAASLNFKVQSSGYDSAKELDVRFADGSRQREREALDG